MSGGGDQGDKKYEASDARKEQFRKDGKYARARDASALAATAALFGALVAARERVATGASQLLVRTVGDLGALERIGFMRATESAAGPLLREVLPAVASAALFAFLAGFAQVGLRLNTDALSPKFDRLNPAQGFQKLFSWKQNSIELGLTLVRFGLIGYAAYWSVSREVPTLMAISRAPLRAAANASADAVGRVVLVMIVSTLLIAAADFAQSWFRLQQEMKMTHNERLEESRQQEGDQKMKGRMKARARANLKKRAMASVKTADVVVTNPTHVAVALRYGAKDAVPIVVAKGHDEFALRIRAEARRYGIPIMENRALARSLDAQVAVGKPIPHASFAAVAQVLAFVYRLKKRGGMSGTSRA